MPEAYRWCVRSFCGVVVLCSSLYTPVWGDTDKTIVDLERSPSDAAPRYHAPRRAPGQYHYDKTEIDLAQPVPPAPSETTQPAVSSPSARSTPPAAPAGTALTPPLPGGGR